MSVRIYQLSKQLKMENKRVIALLQERGLQVDNPSNTIPNIYAESLVEELQKVGTSSKPPPVQVEEKEPEPVIEQKQPKRSEEKNKKNKKINRLPPGRFVKTAQEVEQERSSGPIIVKKAGLPIPPKSVVRLPTNIPPPVKKREPISPQVPLKPKSVSSQATVGEISAPRSLHAPLPAPLISGKPAGAPLPPNIKSQKKQEKKGLRRLQVKPPIVVRDFARFLNVKPFRLISELMEMGVFASMNQTIGEDEAFRVAEKHGVLLEVRHRGEQVETPSEKQEKPKVDEMALLEPRPPVVCVLGHVDHGKTTLLDVIRNTNVVAGEAGGITQHVGAYQIVHKEQKITFIDTPGHAAFSKMRERGANVTDIVVLVVAADDGFMPQTDEALRFAKRANVSVIVAINKMDVQGADIDRVKKMMAERGIMSEDWGGDTLCVAVSAKKGENIENLLELILLQSEINEYKANPKCPAEGVVIESQMEVGRGSTATLIVQNGTLKSGNVLICGKHYCKVRAMLSDAGKVLKSAPPSCPVLILGWSGVPEAGASFKVVKNEREARQLAEETIQIEKLQEHAESVNKSRGGELDHLFAAIETSKEKVFCAVLKADVHGAVEALAQCLLDIKSDKVKMEVVAAEVGPISKNDVTMASATKATIVGFNVKIENGVRAVAKQQGVQIIQHNIIYELIDQVKEAMAEMLDPILQEKKLGVATIRQIFPVSKGVVAGCMVTDGRMVRERFARIIRKGKEICHGKISTLKRFKDDVVEVRSGYECGLCVDNFEEYQEGDSIECFEIEKIQPSL